MSMRVKINIDAGAILSARGLGESKEAQHFLAEETARLHTPYVPVLSGALVGSAVVSDDMVCYNTPYAHYQYEGLKMAGSAPKHYTGEALNHGSGGPKWHERMMADCFSELLQSFAGKIGGKAK